MIMMKRRAAILISFLLTACSSDPVKPPLPDYVAPAEPSQNAIAGQARSVAAEVKLTSPWEISGLRQTDHGGPGAYYVCLREANPPPDKRARYYAIFFNGDDQKGFRLSVILDECESQTFSPLPTSPAAPVAADTQQPTGHKKRRGATQ